MKMKFLYAFLIFFSVNILAAFLLPQTEWDMTAEKEYTLSKETKAFLKAMKEEVTVKVYFSPDLIRQDGRMANHLHATLQKLERLKGLSKGKIRMETVPVYPMTEEESEAAGAGLEKLPSQKAGVFAYLGAVFLNDTDKKRSIPFLAPERALFFEYDFMQRIREASGAKKPKVTLMSTIAVDGVPDQADMLPRFKLMDEIRDLYDVNVLPARAPFVPEDTDILVIINPGNFYTETEEAIVSYLENGGSVLILMDSFSETARLYNGESGTRDPNLQIVFKRLGIKVPKQMVVADMASALPIVETDRGKITSVLHPTRITLSKQLLNASDAMTAGIPFITLSTPTFFEFDEESGKGLKQTMLAETSKAAMAVKKTVLYQLEDPSELVTVYEPAGRSFMIAAKIEDEKSKFKAVVIADTDLIIDSLAENTPNHLFVLNALEYLSPTDMIGARSKINHARTLYKFSALINMLRFHSSLMEQAVLNQAAEREEYAQNIIGGKVDGSVQENAQRLAEIRKEVEQDKKRLTDLSKHLVFLEETVKTVIVALNMLTVPLVIGVILLVKRRKRKNKGTDA